VERLCELFEIGRLVGFEQPQRVADDGFERRRASLGPRHHEEAREKARPVEQFLRDADVDDQKPRRRRRAWRERQQAGAAFGLRAVAFMR